MSDEIVLIAAHYEDAGVALRLYPDTLATAEVKYAPEYRDWNASEFKQVYFTRPVAYHPDFTRVHQTVQMELNVDRGRANRRIIWLETDR